MRRGLRVLAAGMAAGLGLATPAFAADSIAATGNATSVGQTSADLNGAVYREQIGARWLFEYSTSAHFDGIVQSTPAVATSSRLTAVERRVTGLEPGTVYYFRIVVVTRGGTHTVQTFGANGALQTLAATSSSASASASARRHRG